MVEFSGNAASAAGEGTIAEAAGRRCKDESHPPDEIPNGSRHADAYATKVSTKGFNYLY